MSLPAVAKEINDLELNINNIPVANFIEKGQRNKTVLFNLIKLLPFRGFL